MANLVCSPCGGIIPPRAKFFAIFPTETGFRLEIGCEHVAVANLDQAEVVIGSEDCFLQWVCAWSNSLRCHDRGLS